MSQRSNELRGAEQLGVREFQRQIEAIYFDRDQERGKWSTYAWLVEEVGELARALRVLALLPETELLQETPDMLEAQLEPPWKRRRHGVYCCAGLWPEPPGCAACALPLPLQLLSQSGACPPRRCCH